MNKTLLLILVDFLLLTILSLTEWTDDAEPQADSAAGDAESRQSVAAMAMMEQDLLDALQFSLEEQREAQEALAASLDQTESDLQRREQRIQNLESNLTEAQAREAELQRARAALESTKQEIESQAQSLAEQVEQTRAQYSQATSKLEETELAARQSEAQSRMLQEELQRRLAEIEAKEQALADATSKLQESQSRIQELDVAVKMSEQERSFLQESVSTLRSEIVSEREERQRVQEQAGQLAQGVSKLAETSQDIRQELRSSIPINANQLFAQYQANQVAARFDSLKRLRDRVSQFADETSTILVREGDSVYALTHIERGPFGIKTNPGSVRALRLILSRGGERVSASSMRFLDDDPRVVLVPLTPEQVERLDSAPYFIAPEDPFKFPEAVLVNSRGDYYGEVEFKLDADTPGYVRMQSRIFSALFGEFSPSTGDLVLSKTGELLGVMVNSRYCVLIRNLASSRGIDIGGELDAERFRETLDSLDATVRSYPRALR